MNRRLDQGKLEIYQASLAFVARIERMLQLFPKALVLTDQLERASTFTPLYLAKGSAEYTGAHRCRYFDNPRGSALESATLWQEFSF